MQIFHTVRALRWKNMVLCVFVGLFLFFAVLYGYSERENRLLTDMQTEKYRALAAEEAAAAITAWQKNAPEAVLYHHIRAAADHLAMSVPSPENTDLVKQLMEASETVLQGEVVPDMDVLLHRITSVENLTAEQGTAKEKDMTDYVPWGDQTRITRQEGIKRAESLTGARNILHAAAGGNYVYTCENVYIKLSAAGGIPLEAAFFPYPLTTEREERTISDMTMQTIHFLEKALPQSLFRRTSVPESGSGEWGYTVMYPVGSTHQAELTMRGGNWLFRMRSVV